MYTDTCDLLSAGFLFKMRTGSDSPGSCSGAADVNERASPPKDISAKNAGSTGSKKKKSAYEVHQKSKKKSKSEGGDGKGMNAEQEATTLDGTASLNPIQLLKEAARQFGVKHLGKRCVFLAHLARHFPRGSTYHLTPVAELITLKLSIVCDIDYV